ncbi:hypothetical protein Pcinc_011270 [Petrolisthes cinctipes]|uniref:Uncharacterized protein n=1 Tax=Petrolisthes cinctipes TaxID=88211 RepID=A0AAE1G759_PETCI|nr:hypothetical protein Pcinc_011270 [Petrolisthes cinctipes]
MSYIILSISMTKLPPASPPQREKRRGEDSLDSSTSTPPRFLLMEVITHMTSSITLTSLVECLRKPLHTMFVPRKLHHSTLHTTCCSLDHSPSSTTPLSTPRVAPWNTLQAPQLTTTTPRLDATNDVSSGTRVNLSTPTNTLLSIFPTSNTAPTTVDSPTMSAALYDAPGNSSQLPTLEQHHLLHLPPEV